MSGTSQFQIDIHLSVTYTWIFFFVLPSFFFAQNVVTLAETKLLRHSFYSRLLVQTKKKREFAWAHLRTLICWAILPTIHLNSTRRMAEERQSPKLKVQGKKYTPFFNYYTFFAPLPVLKDCFLTSLDLHMLTGDSWWTMRAPNTHGYSWTPSKYCFPPGTSL